MDINHILRMPQITGNLMSPTACKLLTMVMLMALPISRIKSTNITLFAICNNSLSINSENSGSANININKAVVPFRITDKMVAFLAS